MTLGRILVVNDKKKKVALLLAYAVPYMFLAAYGDGKYGTMLFYGVMIAALVGLFVMAYKTQNVRLIIPGNIISAIVSAVITKNSELVEMNYYFKPLTAFWLVIAVSVIALVVQLVVMYCIKKQI